MNTNELRKLANRAIQECMYSDFYAAASPAQVITLLDEIDRLRTEAVAADIRIENDKLEFQRIYAVLRSHAEITQKAEAEREAALADHAMDAPVTDTPEQIVKSIIAMAVTMATDSTIAAGAVRSIPKGIRRKLLDELGAEWEGADGNEWDDAVVTMVENYLAAGAAPVPEGWQPIETAPKDGVELIGWRKDCGAILIRWTSCSELMTEPEIEQSGIDDATLFSEDWFCAGGRLEGCEIPTNWMSLPAAPKEPT